jgi:hypothetical protein
MGEYVLLGACGLYCGACNHYRASFTEGKHLLDEAAAQGRNLEGFTCGGCRSDKLYMHKGCIECNIRSCVEAKGLEHCGECEKLPCDKLAAFQNDGRAHHLDVVLNAEAIRETGIDHWLSDQEVSWRCGCGFPFSWYESKCVSCSGKLDSYGSGSGQA